MVLPPGVNRGLYRQGAIRSFNTDYFYHDKVPNSPLAPLAYIDPVNTPADQHIPDYANNVMMTMLYLPWVENYGLSYEQTMQLPYEEWQRMVAALQDKVQRGVNSDNSMAATLKQISQNLIEILNRQNIRQPPKL